MRVGFDYSSGLYGDKVEDEETRVVPTDFRR